MNLTSTDILSKLHERKPISIVRSGDGEKIVLQSNDSVASYRTCIDNVMKRQMGYEPTMAEVDAIRTNLQTAYQNADIVGVPMHSNLADLGKHWNEVQVVVEPFCTSKDRCSTDVFYDLLYTGELVEWLRTFDTVNYIGCRNIDEGFQRLGIKQVNSFIIAPEAKFTSGYEGQPHYPNQFNTIERWMSKCAIEGNACLVGAGVIGKIYTNWFRDRGGIACDVGAVMDLWAGRRTRGSEKGLDVEYDKFKL